MQGGFRQNLRTWFHLVKVLGKAQPADIAEEGNLPVQGLVELNLDVAPVLSVWERLCVLDELSSKLEDSDPEVGLDRSEQDQVAPVVGGQSVRGRGIQPRQLVLQLDLLGAKKERK